jgi:hypothetical protein
MSVEQYRGWTIKISRHGGWIAHLIPPWPTRKEDHPYVLATYKEGEEVLLYRIITLIDRENGKLA